MERTETPRTWTLYRGLRGFKVVRGPNIPVRAEYAVEVIEKAPVDAELEHARKTVKRMISQRAFTDPETKRMIRATLGLERR